MAITSVRRTPAQVTLKRCARRLRFTGGDAEAKKLSWDVSPPGAHPKPWWGGEWVGRSVGGSGGGCQGAHRFLPRWHQD